MTTGGHPKLHIMSAGETRENRQPSGKIHASTHTESNHSSPLKPSRSSGIQQWISNLERDLGKQKSVHINTLLYSLLGLHTLAGICGSSNYVSDLKRGVWQQKSASTDKQSSIRPTCRIWLKSNQIRNFISRLLGHFSGLKRDAWQQKSASIDSQLNELLMCKIWWCLVEVKNLSPNNSGDSFFTIFRATYVSNLTEIDRGVTWGEGVDFQLCQNSMTFS